MKKNTRLNFKGQIFYIGLDVHKRSWNVAIRSNGMLLKVFSMNPDPFELWKYLRKNYPDGIYRSVYEAGYMGFTAHRQLEELGIMNIVVHAADIPTSNKEKMMKTDQRDSTKLARELEKGTLHGIYIPDKLSQEIRSFSRLRYQMSRNQARVKNRIKSYLAYYGHKLPENTEMQHWTMKFIKHLRTLKFDNQPGKEQLEFYIEELLELRKRLTVILKSLRKHMIAYGREKDIKLLLSLPGFGYIVASTFIAELIDINRFRTFDDLACYVGLVPSTRSSGEKDLTTGLSRRFSRPLRVLIIEAAWVAVRKDAALTKSFHKLTRKMSKQEAIIRIAKKLLSRMKHVWQHREPYVYAVIK